MRRKLGFHESVSVGGRLRSRATAGIAAILIVCASSPAQASGFILDIQSVGSASVSTAGQTAIAEDATTIYYNPAGMTALGRPEILISSGLVFTSSNFSNGGTNNAAGQPVLGTTGVVDQIFLVPTVFATLPLSDRLHIGVGVFTPFGQVSAYDDNWVGRYHSQSTSLKTIEIDPAAAYRINDNISIGAGIDVQYAHLSRRNAIDFGSLCFGVIGPTPCLALGLLPGSADGSLIVNGRDWSVGYNLGVLYEDDATHIGFSYRSSVGHDFAGEADFSVPAAAAPLTRGGLLFQDASARASLTFPGVLALGISQKIDDRLTLLFDLDRTLWSRLKQITLNFGNPLQPPQTIVFNWHDSNRYAIGGIYHFDNTTDVRAGFSYDQSPVSDAFRASDVPDSDQMMVSTGLMHRFSEQFSATVSYSFGYYVNAPVNHSTPEGGTLIGKFQRRSNALGLQTRFVF